MNNQKTGALIAAIRKEQGLTQEQLGEKLHVTGKAVSKWERGLSFPGVDILEKLAGVLGITVTELLAGQRVKQEDLNEKAQQLALQMLKREKRAFYRTLACAAVIVLLVLAWFLNTWGPVIFQRGNPLPYLLAAAHLSEGQPYVKVKEGPSDVYITRRGPCPALLEMVEDTRAVTFVEQAGSGFLFTNGADSLVVSSEIYWRYFTVWTVPTRTLQSP